ncbi:MAG: insecticidal toxin protein, partial [Anaerolineae bacterium]|nr:insecticidal toxin protein [Anaerolineae bacterium]
ELRADTVRAMQAWASAPFRPHVIARFRQQAYMLKTVTAYLDNLIAWGDSLFRQDTGEAIDEAFQLYVLAANILGPRPQPVPAKGTIRPQTYANLRQDLKQFGVVQREIETAIPWDLMPYPSDEMDTSAQLAILSGMGKALYFCVPRNDKLMGYWDTVADRLFKIRNSLNIQGVFRQLALFEPPIDPALLARAAAAGLDVGAIVNGLNQPLPLVRFQMLVRHAAEICQEVKALGNSLLVAMEKEDGEEIALLRARHERAVMELVEQIRYGQLQTAIKEKEALLQSLAEATYRYVYFERQLGKTIDEIKIPEYDELDKNGIDRLAFEAQEPDMPLRDIEIDIAEDLGDSSGKIVSSYEAQALEDFRLARDYQISAQVLKIASQAVSLFSDPKIDLHYWGVGITIDLPGGSKFASFIDIAAETSRIFADLASHSASLAEKVGNYSRREQEWAFQSNLAAGEITQVFKQLRAAQIREAVAEYELKSHRLQMQHAAEIERFLNAEGTEKKGKKTNKALYTWMKREVKGLYGQSFQLAFDVARKAERALQHELGDPSLNYLQFGYLAGKEGLLAGDKLFLDIKRMEMAYNDINRREYELVKHISLRQVDPLALLQLRATGACEVTLPEELFDMDGPGHYFRRIKTVAVSIPCVTGPYASVNCTLTLLKSSVRTSSGPGAEGYVREGPDDTRFSDHFGSLQSIVTSSAQNDSGLFETNLRDERYLPFEGSGAISTWRLQLPSEVPQFDYDTISDVILHVRYTAREGGELLRSSAETSLITRIEAAQAAGMVRLFSIRHEFPNAWASFKSTAITTGGKAELELNLRSEHYPFWSMGRLKGIERVDVIARTENTTVKVWRDNSPQTDELGDDSVAGLLAGTLSEANRPDSPITTEGNPLKLLFDVNSMDDLWLVVAWKGE